MRYLIYILLLYVFLPFGYRIDLISILLFFVVMNEDSRFSIAFAFLCGLLVDLYYPAGLGINALIFTLLSQAIIFVKKYIAKEPLTTMIVFGIFYALKTIAAAILLLPHVNIMTIGLTLVLFLPLFLLLNRVLFRVWMKA
jgi:rod shape-determining protein MreD